VRHTGEEGAFALSEDYESARDGFVDVLGLVQGQLRDLSQMQERLRRWSDKGRLPMRWSKFTSMGRAS
jgi:hypothetical protein